MSAKGHRLEKGGRIDRSTTLHFSFNGKNYTGYEGDTLASALLANGVSLTARSFKYHRPRGIVGAWVEEPSTIVELQGDDQSSNHPVTTVKLKEGLRAKSVNCWPSPDFDLLSVNQLFSRLLPAAFYYKTFKWPHWHWFEPAIRRAAGLAQAPQLPKTKDNYENRYGNCDILIIGAGPAGLVAALCAARSGLRVMLVDDGYEAGGSLLSSKVNIDGGNAVDWVTSVIEELSSFNCTTILQNATAWGYRESNLVLITEHNPEAESLYKRTWRVRAGHVIVATGAIERHLPFADNDRPGVMLCSAVSTYVNRYAVLPGRQLVVFSNNSSVYQAAAGFLEAGMNIVAIVDSRDHVSDAERELVPGVKILAAHEILKTHGKKRLNGVTVRQRGGQSLNRIDCDLVCVSGGWSPTVHLFSQSRGTLKFNETLAAFVPDTPEQATSVVGAASGVFNLPELFIDSADKTGLILSEAGYRKPVYKVPEVSSDINFTISPLWFVEQEKPTDSAFVDLQNDVTVNDIQLAIREGFGAVEHMKRYTTAGMGLDQGRTGNINAIGVVAHETGATIEDIGTTTFRSPFVPIEFGAIGGLREESVIFPYRHTPVTQWNKDNGAFMYESGARWRRPGYYPLPNETFQQTVNREATTVRSGVAVYDGSPLGKFELKGPDALRLLEVLYTNSFASLEINNGRYGIMLNEDGLIIDDGVTFKLGENHYLMSTSTGHADDVYKHMEHFLQVERPDWKVRITVITCQWANATICGPDARKVMESLDCSIDLSAEAFPFMSIRTGTVAGIPARVCRVSFTGELSYEINVASRNLLSLWEQIIHAGKDFKLVPIGSEANHVLRVEKGFLSLGHEVDGTTDPVDLGMSWILSKNKSDYIGKRAVEIRRSKKGPRRELVGLLTEDPNRMIPEGAPLTPNGTAAPSEGLVTASVWSVVNGRVVSLALLYDGRNRMGETVCVRLKDEIIKATVTTPCFHDSEGKLLRS
ncbi:sarcosine oxidase subunit alpha [Chromatiales bacterium (ex Bugula neritina AB1)]|nr:sarcosine oxidase subunit alpha [Chromatiales bacterium (ex Bugula neritina AB1)]